jgi:SAM-dependent methyltransferase
MNVNDPYAPAPVWDRFFTALADEGKALNPEGWWVPDFLPFLRAAQVQRVLDVGCGTGGDAVLLARHGFQVTGMDYSPVALAQVQANAAAAGVVVEFREGDMAQPFPFGDGAFDAVMSNVAMHMFDDPTTRQIIGEMHRVARPNGLLLLNVNSTEDLTYRSERLGRFRVETLGPDFYREASGQTMHFFSEEYCRDVLTDWTILDLTHVQLRDAAGAVFKCVWRCVAQKPVALMQQT